jgi:hypothetical protein
VLAPSPRVRVKAYPVGGERSAAASNRPDAAFALVPAAGAVTAYRKQRQSLSDLIRPFRGRLGRGGAAVGLSHAQQLVLLLLRLDQLARQHALQPAAPIDVYI